MDPLRTSIWYPAICKGKESPIPKTRYCFSTRRSLYVKGVATNQRDTLYGKETTDLHATRLRGIKSSSPVYMTGIRNITYIAIRGEGDSIRMSKTVRHHPHHPSTGVKDMYPRRHFACRSEPLLIPIRRVGEEYQRTRSMIQDDDVV